MRFELPKAAIKWDAYVAEKMKRGLTRERAVAEVARQHPALKQRLIAEANQPTEGSRR